MTHLIRGTEYAFYLFIFLLPWQTKLILRPAPTAFTEISFFLTHALLLFILLTFFIYKLRRRKHDVPVSWPWAMLALLEVAVLASFFVASDQVLAFYHYVIVLMGVGTFYILREGTIAKGYEEHCFDRLKATYSLLAGLFFQASLGIYQFLTQRAWASKYLGLAAHDPNELGTAVVETADGRWLRAYGGLDHPNVLGGVLAISLIIAAYLLAKRKMIRSWREMAGSALLFIYYFTALFAAFFSFSRAAWLAAGIGMFYLAFNLMLKKDWWIFGRFMVLMFFSLGMIAVVAFPYRDLVFTRLTAAGRLEVKSVEERRHSILQAREIIGEKWLAGVGPGNYTTELARRDNHEKPAWDYQPVHNSFLLLFAQSGFLALIAFVAYFLLLWRGRREALAGPILTAFLVILMLEHWLISLPFGLIFFFLVLGLI